MPFKDLEKKKQYSLAYSERYRREHKQEIRERGAKSRLQLKYAVLAYYSSGEPRCAHCGETDLICLCIDHMEGKGNSHRRLISGNKAFGGSGMHYWLRNNDFPKGFQVLCWNCNARKTYEGGL